MIKTCEVCQKFLDAIFWKDEQYALNQPTSCTVTHNAKCQWVRGQNSRQKDLPTSALALTPLHLFGNMENILYTA